MKKKIRQEESLSTEVALSPEVTLEQLQEVLDGASPEYLAVLAPTLKELIGLVQIATCGDASSVAELLEKPGNFMEKLLALDSEGKGLLLGFLKAKGLHQVMTTKTRRDPLEWARLILAIEELQKKKDEPRETNRIPTSREVARYSNPILQEVEGNGEETGRGGSEQGGN